MPSITTWTRLETRTRTKSIEIGLAARAHDPLWFLTRQWQLGEFQGEDAGTPVQVSMRAEVGKIDRYHAGLPGPGTGERSQSIDVDREPLEAIVERETLDTTTIARLGSEAGRHFLRLLQAAGLAPQYSNAFVGAYSRSADSIDQNVDPPGRLFARLIGRSVPDAFKLRKALRGSMGEDLMGPLPPDLGIDPADAAAVANIARRWLAWFGGLVSEPKGDESAWSTQRLEHEFAIAARLTGGEQMLVADEYEGGNLDWWAFDRQEPTVALGAATEPTIICRQVVPAHVSYGGMPAARFWEFEDARVDLGAVEGGSDDLARMLLVQFALGFGNDWFLAPIEIPVGTLCRIDSVVVTDTFGIRMLVRPSRAAMADNVPWRMFTLSGHGPNEDTLFLPPVLPRSLDGPARERVVIVRDELANLSWAVEELVESATGIALHRDEEGGGRTAPPGGGALPPGDYEAVWQVMTDVAPHWFPLDPEAPTGERARRLVLKPLVRADNAGGVVIVPPHGRLLREQDPFFLFEEEVLREGVRIERAWQAARWLGGRSLLWSARRVGVGRGPAASGLRFDTLKPVPPS